MKRKDDFRQWMLDNENNKELDIVLGHILETSETYNPHLAEEGFSTFKGRVGLARKHFLHRHSSFLTHLAAAALLPVAVISIWAGIRIAQNNCEWKKITTSYAEKRNVLLSDGTRIEMSPCSELFYPEKFIGKERKIFIQGEAFLDVAKDKRKTFVVDAGKMTILVHGTRFNVSSFHDSQEDEVALVEGSVEMRFADNEGSIFLVPGEMVKVDNCTGNIERRKFAVNYYEEVVDAGGLQFNNVPLADIVSALNRHFDVSIIINDDKLAKERYFASFINGENLNEILLALNVQNHFKVHKKENIIYITHQ